MSTSTAILNPLLRPLGFLYGTVACIRRKFYTVFGLRKTVDIPAWVIGNLSVGGSGKTPLVIELLQRLRKKRGDGISVATLSRGYGRKSKGFFQVTEFDSEKFGDEPCELYATLAGHSLLGDSISEATGVGVYVGENRVEALARIKSEGFDLVLLDDGMQHLPLQATGYILTTDYAKLPDQDFCMPAGRLREFVSCTELVDFIVVTKCPGDLVDAHFEGMRSRLKGLIKEDLRNESNKRILFIGQGLSFFTVSHSDGKLTEVDISLVGSEGSAFFAVTGVVGGEGVIAGWKHFLPIVEQRLYRDHFRYERRHIQEWVNEMRQQGILNFVCTRKDWMRILPYLDDFGCEIQLIVVGTAPVLLEPMDDFEFLLNEILKKN